MVRIQVGLRQGYVMSLWLYNPFIDSAVGRKTTLRTRGMECLWKTNTCLFVDDAALITEAGEKLSSLNKGEKKVEVNVGKRKARRSSFSEEHKPLRLRHCGIELEATNDFKYLDLAVCAKGGIKMAVNHKLR